MRRAFSAGVLAAVAVFGVACGARDEGGELVPPIEGRPSVPQPAGLPAHLGLGMADQPGGVATMQATAPFDYRYQYLAGGVWDSWEAWPPGGRFVEAYVAESKAAGMVPVFTYYNLVQSIPDNRDEHDRALDSLKSDEIMDRYLRGLVTFFQQAKGDSPVILQVEPDLWGFAQQAAKRGDPASVSAAVQAAGLPELEGLPATLAGFAQALDVLRDLYAPNVLLALHASNWATGEDYTYTRPSSTEVDEIAADTAAFFTALGAQFDLLFAEFSDRDAGFREQQYGDRGASWWTPADFARHVRFLEGLAEATGRPIVLWQIPYGNTQMQAIDETWNHYGDNRVEWLLGPEGATHLAEYAAAGVIALLFGRGADGATDASDAAHDGVSNGSTAEGRRPSASADDDGGLFRELAKAYYAAGPVSLP